MSRFPPNDGPAHGTGRGRARRLIRRATLGLAILVPMVLWPFAFLLVFALAMIGRAFRVAFTPHAPDPDGMRARSADPPDG